MVRTAQATITVPPNSRVLSIAYCTHGCVNIDGILASEKNKTALQIRLMLSPHSCLLFRSGRWSAHMHTTLPRYPGVIQQRVRASRNTLSWTTLQLSA